MAYVKPAVIRDKQHYVYAVKTLYTQRIKFSDANVHAARVLRTSIRTEALPHCRLTPPLQRTSANIRIKA